MLSGLSHVSCSYSQPLPTPHQTRRNANRRPLGVFSIIVHQSSQVGAPRFNSGFRRLSCIEYRNAQASLVEAVSVRFRSGDKSCTTNMAHVVLRALSEDSAGQGLGSLGRASPSWQTSGPRQAERFDQSNPLCYLIDLHPRSLAHIVEPFHVIICYV